MGMCVGSNGQVQHSKQVDSAKSKFEPLELELLQLMYGDLARRCKNNIVTRDTFEVFFHANGLMAELLFSRFDPQQTGVIGQQDFLRAFQVMVKGSFEQKADVLFEFYSMEKSGGIRYSQLLKILFSYPLEDLNKILVEEEDFIKFLGENMLTYYFGPERKIQEKTIIEDASESSMDYSLRKGSVYAPSSNQYIEMQARIRQIVELDRKERKVGLPEIFQKHRGIVPVEQKRSGSEVELGGKRQHKPSKLKSNVPSITKKYATYLFKSLNLDKEKDVFSKEHFYRLLKDHPSIFDVYMSGFHGYVWQVDVRGSPEYLGIAPWMEGQAQETVQLATTPVYLRFVRTTIFIFTHKASKLPKDIVNLEGLTVTAVDNLGFKLKHRDGLYPNKVYIVDTTILREEWMKQLADFRESSIFDQYLKLERIGGGNFSNVFRGKDKLTGKLVAIKVIEPLRLKANEREVLKRECGILKQVHHPNIVKFIADYKTKTHLYIVTELLTEGDLFEYTRRNKFLDQYEAALIFRQLADTILYLNESGIIHRDLKPQNVMIITSEDKKIVKRIKLIDFGFGVFKDKLKDLPPREKFAGTPGFIAPEVYEAREYDERIDTFSLGIILYFMLYGYLPFQSNFLEQIQEMTMSCNICLVNAHWANVSTPAKDLIMRILTPVQQRITTKQVMEHPWLQDIEGLKEYTGRNRGRRIL